MEEHFKVLNSKVPASRIIGGAGIRGESGHGSLLLSPALAFDNISRMNTLMRTHGALGSIVTDWPDGGTSWMNALSFFTAQGASTQGTPLDAKWKRTFAREYFGVDIPEWFDRYDSVYGPIPLAFGFQTRMKKRLNRHEFKDICLEEELERILKGELSFPGGGGTYWHCHRRLVLKEWINTLEELRPQVTKRQGEFDSFILTFKAAELLLSLSLGHLMRYLDKRGELIYAYQLTPSLSEDDLARSHEEMSRLTEEMIAFYSRFSAPRHVRHNVERLFNSAFRI